MNLFFTKTIATFIGTILLSASTLAATQETAKLLTTATEGSGKAQLKAIDHLGELRGSPATVVPKLRQLLKSDEDQVQWRSARALGDYGALAKEAAGDLVTLLKDNDEIVQYHAAIALG